MDETRHYQHFVPKHRLKKWNNSDNKHYEYNKDGTFYDYCGVGKNISQKFDLYEPVDGEYNTNEIEKDFFGDNKEREQKNILKNIEQIIDAKNILNFKEGKFVFPENNISNYNSLKNFIELSVARLPDSVDMLNEEKINKLDFFEYSQGHKNTHQIHEIKIYYIENNNEKEMICPDIGCIREQSKDLFKNNYTFIFLTPKIGLYSKAIKNNGVNKYPKIYIELMQDDFIDKINEAAKIVCLEKFISRKEIKET